MRCRVLRRGAAAVEFAVVLPLLALIFVGTVDFGRVFHYAVVIENCAYTGAGYAGMSKANAAKANDANIAAAAKLDGGGLKSMLTVNVTRDDDADPSFVEVEVQCPFSTVTAYPLPANLNSFTLVRRVRVNVAKGGKNW